jgi:hypothetical protein
MLGQSLAVQLMGKAAVWGPRAIFAYNYRFVTMQGVQTEEPATFASEMWTAYSPAPPQNVNFGQ